MSVAFAALVVIVPFVSVVLPFANFVISIGEVASIFDVNTSLIRFWEKEFTQIQPKKNKKGERLFTVKDIELFNKIYQLVKGEGYTLDGAKKALKSKTVVVKTVNNTTDHTELIEKLEKIKAQLLQLK